MFERGREAEFLCEVVGLGFLWFLWFLTIREYGTVGDGTGVTLFLDLPIVV